MDEDVLTSPRLQSSQSEKPKHTLMKNRRFGSGRLYSFMVSTAPKAVQRYLQVESSHFQEPLATQASSPWMHHTIRHLLFASQYDEETILGQGAHGTVHLLRARCQWPKGEAVVCRVCAVRAENAGLELRLLESLTHPHILRHFASWVDATAESRCATCCVCPLATGAF